MAAITKRDTHARRRARAAEDGRTERMRRLTERTHEPRPEWMDRPETLPRRPPGR